MRIRPCESSPAERAHGPPRGVEQYSASRGDLTELEASRSIAPSSVAGRADGEALAARQVLCARMGFWPFVGVRRRALGVRNGQEFCVTSSTKIGEQRSPVEGTYYFSYSKIF